MARTSSCHFQSISRQAETPSYGKWQEPVLAIFKWQEPLLATSKRQFKVVMVLVVVIVMVFVMVMVMVIVMGMAMVMVGYWQDPVLAIL